MSTQLQQLIMERLKTNVSECYKEDPAKLRAMRQSNTRGSGLSADDLQANMADEYRSKAIQSLVASKFNAKKIQSIMMSKMSHIADTMDMHIPVEITHAANTVKHSIPGMDEFAVVSVNISGSIDQDEDYAFELGPITLSMFKTVYKTVLMAQLSVHLPASADLELFKIAQVRIDDYNSPVQAINALAAKAMETLTADDIYKKVVTWIHEG